MRTYVSDFETTCNTKDLSSLTTRVWLWDVCELESLEHTTGETIDDFFKSIAKLAPCTIYFHNLKFDGNFIISWLLSHGYVHKERTSKQKPLAEGEFSTLITALGVFYNISVHFRGTDEVITFRDSLKKIQGSVREIAKAFKLPISKGDCDYTLYREEGYKPTPEEIDYVRRDTEVIARVLKIEYDKGMGQMTSASDTMKLYEASLRGRFREFFPMISNETDYFIRQAYRGGVCQVNPKYKGVEVYVDNVYDVNSMYPFQMCSKLLPYGKPEYFKGRYNSNISYPLYIQRIRACFKLKKGLLPTLLDNRIAKVFNSENTYVYSTKGLMEEFVLTNLDLELLKSHYDILAIEYVDGYMFHASSNLFKHYVKPLYDQKCKTTGAEKQLCKILINSLYGKFASQTRHYAMIPYLDKDGIVRYKCSTKATSSPSIYTAMSCFITAYARVQLFEAIDNNMEIFMYCDTDSVHLNGIGKDIWVDDKELGAWKIESDEDKIVKAKYLGAKCYYQVRESGIDNIRIAGASLEVKNQMTYDRFRIGETFGGKLLPKRVKGGVILAPTEFTIKDR